MFNESRLDRRLRIAPTFPPGPITHVLGVNSTHMKIVQHVSSAKHPTTRVESSSDGKPGPVDSRPVLNSPSRTDSNSQRLPPDGKERDQQQTFLIVTPAKDLL